MADSVKIRITGDASEFEQTLRGVGQSAGSVFKGMMGSQIVTAGFRALTNGIRESIQTGMEFEAAMSQVAAISGATGEELQQLTDTAKMYGETTMFSATQAAEALSYMALAGWDAQQSMDALSGVLDLAAASGMDLGKAADAVTDYLSAFGMEASQAGYMADMMAYAQSNANTSASGLSDAYGNCASSMHAAGQDIETTTAMLMALANQGIKGSEAGTQMAAVMRDLTQKMSDGKVMIGDTAVQVTDAAGNFRDLNDIMADVASAIDGMGTAEASAALMETFTARSVKAVQTILNEGIENVNQYEEALRGSEGTAAQQADVMMDNLKGDIQIFQSALEGLQITASESMNETARTAVQTGTDIMTALNNAAKREGLAGIGKELTRQLPKLIPDAMKGLKTLVDGLAKNLPEMVGNLLQGLPDLLSGVMDLLPGILEGMGDLTGSIIEGLISSLPGIIEGVVTALPGAIMGALKGIGGVIQGAFDGLNIVLKDLGIIPPDLDDVIGQAFENVDASHIQVSDVNLPDISLDGDIDTTSYTNKLETAKTELQTAIDGLKLSDTDAEALKKALMQGSGADALKAALTALNIPEADVTAAVTAIEGFKTSINQVFSDFGIEDTDGTIAQNIADAVAMGQSLESALQEFAGLSAEDAKVAADKLQPDLDALIATYNALNLNGLDTSSIISAIDAANTSLADALASLAGLSTEEAQTAATNLQPGLTALESTFNSLNLDVDFSTFLAEVAKTGDVETALQTLANLSAEEAKTAASKLQPDISALESTFNSLNLNIDFSTFLTAASTASTDLATALQAFAGLSAEDAKTAATALEPAISTIKTELGKLNLDGVNLTTFLNACLKEGGNAESALQELADLSAEDAQTAATALQPAIDSIKTTLAGLNLDGVSLSDFLAAATTANGDIVAALKLLGMTDGQITAALASIDLLANSVTLKVQNAFNKLKEAFTNGKVEDDAQAAEDFGEAIDEAAQTGHEKIDTWLAEYTAQLQLMETSATEYETAMTNAQEKAAAMHAELDATVQAAKDWAAENAGAKTEEVEEHINELEDLVGDIENLEARVEGLREKLSLGDYATRDAVERGLMSSQDSQAKAMQVTAKEYEQNVLEAGETCANALKAADKEMEEAYKDLSAGKIGEEELEKKLEEVDAKKTAAVETREQAEQDAADKYAEHMQAITNGMIEANKGMADALDQAAEDIMPMEVAKKILDAMAENIDAGLEGEAVDGNTLIDGLDITPVEWDALAEALGFDGDGAALREAITQAINNGAPLPGDLRGLADGIEDATVEAVEGVDMTRMAEVLQLAMDEGWLLAAAGEEFDTPEALAKEMIEHYIDSAVDEASGRSEEVTPEIEMDPEVRAAEDTPEEVAEAIEEVTSEGGSGTVEADITVDTHVTAAEGTDEEVADAVQEAAESADAEATATPTMEVAPQIEVTNAEETKAALEAAAMDSFQGMDFNQFLSDANVSQVDFDAMCQAAGIDGASLQASIESALASGDPFGALTSLFDGVDFSAQAQVAGDGVVEGVVTSIEDGTPEAVAAATTFGSETANAVPEGAQVNSPSAITIPAGQGIAEGVQVGIEQGTESAVTAAQNLGQQAAEAVGTAAVEAAQTMGQQVSEAFGSALSGANTAEAEDGQETGAVSQTVDVNVTIGEVTIEGDTDVGAAIGEQLSGATAPVTVDVNASIGSVSVDGSTDIGSAIIPSPQSASLSVNVNASVDNVTVDGTEAIGEQVEAAVEAAMSQGAATAAGAGAQDIGSQISNGVATGVTGSASAVSSAVTGMVNTGVNAGRNSATSATNVGSAFASATSNGIHSASGSVSSAAQSMVQSAISSASGSASGASSVGAAIASGIAAGIRSGASAAVNAAVEMVKKAIAAAKAAADAHSPSRVMYELGLNFDQGFTGGIDEGAREAVRSATSLVNNAIGAANLRPQASYGGNLDNMIAQIAQSMHSTPSDANVSDTVLVLNGTVVAQALAEDNIIAQNSHNRRVAIKYGSINDTWR